MCSSQHELCVCILCAHEENYSLVTVWGSVVCCWPQAVHRATVVQIFFTIILGVFFTFYPSWKIKLSILRFFSLQLVLLFMCSVFLCINSLFVLLVQLCSFSVCSFKYFKAWITLSWHYRSAICVNTLLIWFFFKCILH